MKQVLFATENKSKANRFRRGLKEKGIELLTINDIGKKTTIVEDGGDAIENALIKARAYADLVDMPVFAMDDNLYIECIPDDLQPGMYVRRVGGKVLTDEEMINYYSHLASTYGQNERLTCRWVYGLAVINEGVEKTYTWNKEDFYLVSQKSDQMHPGYPLDSISIDKESGKYFTDMSFEERTNSDNTEKDVLDFIIANIQ